MCTGVTILEQGGNAVDATITTALCQGIMSPAASGLGGGHFMVIRSPNGTTEVIDAREPAPAAANETMFSGMHISLVVRQGKNREVYAFQQLQRALLSRQPRDPGHIAVALVLLGSIKQMCLNLCGLTLRTGHAGWQSQHDACHFHDVYHADVA